MVLVIRSLPVSAGDLRDAGSIPVSGRSPEGGNGNPLQCSCLENPMDRGAWWATVHGATKSQKWLQRLCMYTQLHGCHCSLRSFLLCWSWSLGLWVSQKIHGSSEETLFYLQTPGFSLLLLIDACSQGRKGTEDEIKQKCRVARYLYLFVFPVHSCKRHTQNCCAYVDLNPHQAIYFFPFILMQWACHVSKHLISFFKWLHTLQFMARPYLFKCSLLDI